jgi:hypothetical protein
MHTWTMLPRAQGLWNNELIPGCLLAACPHLEKLHIEAVQKTYFCTSLPCNTAGAAASGVGGSDATDTSSRGLAAQPPPQLTSLTHLVLRGSLAGMPHGAVAAALRRLPALTDLSLDWDREGHDEDP